jgi:hypothetical protein
MSLHGAYEHASSITQVLEGDDFGWWKYLAAHTGKKKQHQQGWIGRSWGVINPEHLTETVHDHYGLTEKQWWAFRRLMRRLLRYRGAGGGRRTVYYARPVTVREMVDWVKKTVDAQGPCAIVPEITGE